MNVNNNIINDPTIIANTFNNFLSSAAVNLINKSSDDTFTVNPLHFPINNLTGPTFNLSLKPATSHEINKIIQTMKLKDSHGYNEVFSRTLKISAAFILSPLTYIFNKSLYAGIFPERMKYSIIKPLYKKGSTSELGNYRPISLLTVFSKLLEKIIYKRLYLYLMEHNLLSCQQFGFRENRSTQTATYSLLNTILMALNKNEFVGGLFCDFHKAFNCVSHSILLEKLDYYGISGTAKKLLGSYLDGRYQRVELMGSCNCNSSTTSVWTLIRHGVPQGSVLGPLLFLIYVNDLPSNFISYMKPMLFADDTSIIISNTNIHEFKSGVELAMN